MGERFVEMQGAARAADLLGDFAGKGMRQAVYRALEVTARDSLTGIGETVDAKFDHPTPFSRVRANSKRSAVVATDIAKGSDETSIGVRVQDAQAQYFGIHLGERSEVREPGEVGVATKANFIPQEYMKNRFGNLSRTALKGLRGRARTLGDRDRAGVEKRLGRAASAEEVLKAKGRRERREAKAGKPLKRADVFFGEVKGLKGFWSTAGRKLKLLVAAVDRSTYEGDTLTPGWNEAMRKAGDRLPDAYSEAVDKVLKLK